MQVDSIFIKGNSHKVCQDYSRHGVTKDEVRYAIISDGCSSSKDTDIGARILVLQMEKFISNNIKDIFSISSDLMIKMVMRSSLDIVDGLGLDKHCLDATLGVVFALPNCKIKAMLWGDGGMFVGFKNSSYSFFQNIEFLENYPVYPAYIMAEEIIMPDENKKRVCGYLINSGDLCSTKVSSSEEALKNSCYSLSFDSTDMEEINFIGVCSDGISSFYSSESSLAPTKVARELTSFKTYTGSFIERRTNSFLKDCKKLVIEHFDDLSVGCVYIGD